MLIDALRGGNLLALLYMVPILMLTLSVHELCHGLASAGLGDGTAREQGRLSLNPLKHIDPMGFVMLLVAGFGWAKPVRVDMRNLQKPKRDFAIVAMAGPLSNFIMAFLFMIAFKLVIRYGGITHDAWPFDMFQYAVVINLGLCTFNMIPVPPLDGSRLVAAFLPDRLYFKYLRLERYGMMLLVALILLSSRIGLLSTAIGALFELMDFLTRWIF